MKSAINLILILLVQTSLTGCSPALETNATQEISTRQLTTEQFTARIENLRKASASRKSEDPVKTGRMHRELARLYLSPHNPKRNLGQAAVELEKYLETEKDIHARDNTENMLKLLKEINKLEQVAIELKKKLQKTNATDNSMREKNSRIRQLSEENMALKKRQDILLEENKKLGMTIEKLKFLDLDLEKKRKTFR